MGGAGWAFSWGPQDDDASIEAIHAGLDAGINWIDTAAVYGLGHAEEVVARALDGMARKPYVFTKCARVWGDDGKIGKCLKRDSVRRECEASLRRLKIDVIYNLVTPDIEAEVLPYCQAHNIGVIVYSPMKSGLLTGKMTRERIAAMPPDDFRQRTPNFQEPLLTRNLELVERLRAIGTRHGRTPGEVAIAWTLRRPEVTAAIVGLRSADQLPGVIGAADFRLSPAEIEEIARA
jgi:aryl-alcohol dehydrogenase-like predicted oxidoreductase